MSSFSYLVTDCPPLSDTYRTCLQSFGRLIEALSQEDCRAVSLQQISVAEILEEYGRTIVWGSQVKADYPPRARGSLDDTLRHDMGLKKLVHSIVVRLNDCLVHEIAEKKIRDSGYDSTSSVSADSDSDSISKSDKEEGYVLPRRRKAPKIRQLFQRVSDQIRSLYDLSALLRRPSVTDKYITSSSSKPGRPGRGHPSLSTHMEQFDDRHVTEVMRKWRGLTKSGEDIDFEDEDEEPALMWEEWDHDGLEDEEPAPMREEWDHDGLEDVDWLRQRLVRGNTRRREQLEYWADNPYEDAEMTLSCTLDAGKQKDSASDVSTIKASTRAGSKRSFSTAALSAVHDSGTNVRPRTIYAATEAGQSQGASIPDPPKTDEETFACLCCGVSLETREMKDRQRWKRHVFHDLRPYVCTFKECNNPSKLYVTRHEWMYHELQIHRRVFECKECGAVYGDRGEMSTHLRRHYGESMSAARLDVVLELCHRQVDIADAFGVCLFCGDKLVLSDLLNHLATHMEQIAIFALPRYDEVGEMKGSDACSTRAVRSADGGGSIVPAKKSNADRLQPLNISDWLSDSMGTLPLEEKSLPGVIQQETTGDMATHGDTVPEDGHLGAQLESHMETPFREDGEQRESTPSPRPDDTEVPNSARPDAIDALVVIRSSASTPSPCLLFIETGCGHIFEHKWDWTDLMKDEKLEVDCWICAHPACAEVYLAGRAAPMNSIDRVEEHMQEARHDLKEFPAGEACGRQYRLVATGIGRDMGETPSRLRYLGPVCLATFKGSAALDSCEIPVAGAILDFNLRPELKQILGEGHLVLRIRGIRRDRTSQLTDSGS